MSFLPIDIAADNSQHNCAKNPLARSLEQSVPKVEFAYQPIVSTKTLAVHGFEALARTDKTEFDNIVQLLESHDNAGDLYATEMALVGNAIDTFMQFENAGRARLFCNMDSRIYEDSSFSPGVVNHLTSSKQLPPNLLCLEVSERYQLENWNNLVDLSKQLSDAGVQVALDDFGIGMSGLHLLLRVEPNYVKIDRSFIVDLATNERQQALVSKLCGLAHSLGFLTIAEGVESEDDLRMSRDLGCDFAQGFHIARPTRDIAELRLEYSSVCQMPSAPRVQEQVLQWLEDEDPLCRGNRLSQLNEFFNRKPEMPVAPVVDYEGNILGAVAEEDLRKFQISDFGRALMENKAAPPLLDPLIKRFPIADATGSVETILNSYVATNSARGLFLANGEQYVGYLSNHALMRLALDREVKIAQDSNPLTLIPGNQAIGRKLDEALRKTGPVSIAHFDFDNFKAFNDSYGFSNGDRALLLFADMLRKYDRQQDVFVGHIGGDDFFILIEKEDDQALDLIKSIQKRFAEDVSCLYSPEDRAAGGITSFDRYGENRFFPMLTVSACAVHLPKCRSHLTVDFVERELTYGKKRAKSGSGLWIAQFDEPWNGCCENGELLGNEEQAKRAAKL